MGKQKRTRRMSQYSRVVDIHGTYWLFLFLSRHFVPNFTFGPTVVKSLRKNISKGFFDCHLMVTEPQKWMKEFAAAGAN